MLSKLSQTEATTDVCDGARVASLLLEDPHLFTSIPRTFGLTST